MSLFWIHYLQLGIACMKLLYISFSYCQSCCCSRLQFLLVLLCYSFWRKYVLSEYCNLLHYKCVHKKFFGLGGYNQNHKLLQLTFYYSPETNFVISLRIWICYQTFWNTCEMWKCKKHYWYDVFFNGCEMKNPD